MREETDLHLDVTWVPFQLNPATPAEGRSLSEYLGVPPERLTLLSEGTKKRAEELGLPFHPPHTICNTTKAHLLAEYAGDEGQGDLVHRALFTAYFVGGKNLSDDAVLTEVALEAGLDPQEALAKVHEGVHTDRLREAGQLARACGVTGVPAFIVSDRYRIAGALPYKTLVDALRSIQKESAPA